MRILQPELRSPSSPGAEGTGDGQGALPQALPARCLSPGCGGFLFNKVYDLINFEQWDHLQQWATWSSYQHQLVSGALDQGLLLKEEDTQQPPNFSRSWDKIIFLGLAMPSALKTSGCI